MIPSRNSSAKKLWFRRFPESREDPQDRLQISCQHQSQRRVEGWRLSYRFLPEILQLRTLASLELLPLSCSGDQRCNASLKKSIDGHGRKTLRPRSIRCAQRPSCWRQIRQIVQTPSNAAIFGGSQHPRISMRDCSRRD